MMECIKMNLFFKNELRIAKYFSMKKWKYLKNNPCEQTLYKSGFDEYYKNIMNSFW